MMKGAASSLCTKGRRGEYVPPLQQLGMAYSQCHELSIPETWASQLILAETRELRAIRLE